jgi:hypothetical protein
LTQGLFTIGVPKRIESISRWVGFFFLIIIYLFSFENFQNQNNSWFQVFLIKKSPENNLNLDSGFLKKKRFQRVDG